MTHKNLARKILVTGASSGIGRSICLSLLQQQYVVLGMARDFTTLPTTADTFTPIPIDFADLANLPENLKKMVAQMQNLSAIICSAGYGQFGGLESFAYADIKRIMDVNFTSQAYVIKTFLPLLKRQTQSHIIIIGSEAAVQGGRKGAVYSASKFALRGFSQALREECSNSGVHVCLINPGMVQTPFFNELEFGPGEDETNYIVPEDIASVVEAILTGRAGTVIDEINLSPLKKVIRFNKKVPTLLS